jgi:type 1 fimbria pilin
MKKILIALTSLLVLAGSSVVASDLVIESKTQTFNEGDSKIKFSGDVKAFL